MLKPCELKTTGLIAAITDRGLPGTYREACITELAERIDNPRAAHQESVPIDLTRRAEQVRTVTAVHRSMAPSNRPSWSLAAA